MASRLSHDTRTVLLWYAKMLVGVLKTTVSAEALGVLSGKTLKPGTKIEILHEEGRILLGARYKL